MLLLDSDIVDWKSSPYRVCKATGSSCTPSCQLFNPTKICDHSDLNLKHQTFAQAYWKYRERASIKNDHWRLFYECFHPKAIDENDEKTQFTAKFPNDIPALNNQQAASNHQVNKNLDPADPAHWSKDRLDKAVKGTELQRRMAATDWDWVWYTRVNGQGHKVDLAIARSKNRFDKLMFDQFSDKYEDTGSYTYEKTNPKYIELASLYEKLQPLLLVSLNFGSTEPVAQIESKSSE